MFLLLECWKLKVSWIVVYNFFLFLPESLVSELALSNHLLILTLYAKIRTKSYVSKNKGNHFYLWFILSKRNKLHVLKKDLKKTIYNNQTTYKNLQSFLPVKLLWKLWLTIRLKHKPRLWAVQLGERYIRKVTVSSPSKLVSRWTLVWSFSLIMFTPTSYGYHSPAYC